MILVIVIVVVVIFIALGASASRQRKAEAEKQLALRDSAIAEGRRAGEAGKRESDCPYYDSNTDPGNVPPGIATMTDDGTPKGQRYWWLVGYRSQLRHVASQAQDARRAAIFGDAPLPSTPAAAPAGLPADWQRYEEPKKLYSIAYPPDWNITKPVSLTPCLRVLSGKGHCVFEVITLGMPDDKKGETASFLKKLTLESLREQHGQKLRVLLDASQSSTQSRLTVEFVEQNEAQITDYFFIQGRNNGFMVNFRTLSSFYPSLQPLFEKIVATFKG